MPRYEMTVVVTVEANSSDSAEEVVMAALSGSVTDADITDGPEEITSEDEEIGEEEETT